MFADSEQECQEWINAVEREMTAMIDPGQKPYFSVSDTGIHTTVKNGFQDVVVGNFDDVSSLVGFDIVRLIIFHTFR